MNHKQQMAITKSFTFYITEGLKNSGTVTRKINTSELGLKQFLIFYVNSDFYFYHLIN